MTTQDAQAPRGTDTGDAAPPHHPDRGRLNAMTRSWRGMGTVYGWLQWPFLAGLGVAVGCTAASFWTTGRTQVLLLAVGAAAVLAVWACLVYAQGYRHVTTSEYEQLAAGGVTHRTSPAAAAAIATEGGILRLARASRWTILLVRCPLRVYRRAVFVFPTLGQAPVGEVVAFNVRAGDRAVELHIPGAGLPPQDRVFVRDSDGAIAITHDLATHLR